MLRQEVATEGGITVEKATEKIQWRISVPLYKNTVIWRQPGLAVGIPLGFVALVIALSSGKSIYAFYGLGLIAALLFFIWIFIMAVYQGTYEAEFVLDDKGALCRTLAKQAKKSLVVNALTAALRRSSASRLKRCGKAFWPGRRRIFRSALPRGA